MLIIVSLEFAVLLAGQARYHQVSLLRPLYKCVVSSGPVHCSESTLYCGLAQVNT